MVLMSATILQQDQIPVCPLSTTFLSAIQHPHPVYEKTWADNLARFYYTDSNQQIKSCFYFHDINTWPMPGGRWPPTTSKYAKANNATTTDHKKNKKFAITDYFPAKTRLHQKRAPSCPFSY